MSKADEVVEAARALGLDPSVIVWPDRREDRAAGQPHLPDPKRGGLSAGEWAALAPCLPDEAPQAEATSNRDFVNAVLDAMRRGRWASRHMPRPTIEAVRRRFARWAHRGIFQAIAASLPNPALSSETTHLLELAVRRARRLKAR